MRNFIANFLYYTGISYILFRLSLFFYGQNHIRSISYHGTPQEDLDLFESHIRFCSRYYSNVNKQDLDAFFQNKKWHKNKPGMIISFDDGHKNNMFAVAILEKYGFTGWFCVVPKFIDCEIEKQPEYAYNNGIGVHVGKYIERNYALSWEDVKKLSLNHEIVSHTLSHHRINQQEDDTLLEQEIKSSKDYIEQKIDKQVDVFCWVGGLTENYSKKAFDCIVASGYTFTFMTNSLPVKKETNPLMIERNCVDTSFSLPYLQFSLSGMMDFFYYSKRKYLMDLFKFGVHNHQ
jgi:peptidoglycan/xylan/chitin deacetylase (PgdA/CDA1 family)